MSNQPPFSLNHEFTLADAQMLESAWRRKWWNIADMVIKAVFTIGLLALAARFFLRGENTMGIVCLVCASLVHHPLANTALYIMTSVVRPRIQTVVDDVGISQRAMGNSTRLYWSMLSHSGEAVEYPSFFLFRLLMEATYIPKRAFESEEQMDAFREFARGKMGERCRFGAAVAKPV